MGRLSGHPLDRALVEATGARSLPRVDGHRAVAGEGAEAFVAGRRVRIGRDGFVAALHGRPTPLAWLHATDTIVWLADERGWIAAFRLRDEPRPEAAAAIAQLRAGGAKVHLLTGDDGGSRNGSPRRSASTPSKRAPPPSASAPT
jgi:Cu2+-exporting ATPase